MCARHIALGKPVTQISRMQVAASGGDASGIPGRGSLSPERQIGYILPEFLRPEERTALLADLESRWGFRRLDGAAQDRHRLRVLTLTADEIEAALRAAGLHDASFPALTPPR